MKKVLKTLAIFLFMLTFVFIGCDNEDPPSPPAKKVIKVESKESVVSLKDTAFQNFDFTSLFEITIDGKTVEVVNDYIKKENITGAVESYKYTCTYEEQSASVTVEVVPTIYSLTIDTTNITITKSLYDDYDFKAFFVAKIDDVVVPIVKEMIDTNVTNEIGEYYYTVTNGDKKLTLNISIVHEYELKANSNVIEVKDVDVIDTMIEGIKYSSLFTLKIDGVDTEIDDELINHSQVSSKPGSYLVTLEVYGKKAQVLIVVIKTNYELTLTTENIVVTIPELDEFDYLKYFEGKIDGELVSITKEMAKSNITTDVGDYEVTVTLGDAVKTLYVKVIHAVSLVSKEERVEIKDRLVPTLDLRTLFTLIIDNKEEKIEFEYLNIDTVSNIPGEYDVICTYDGKNANVKVVVLETIYNITVNIEDDTVKVKKSLYDTLDLNSYFTLYIDNEEVPITSENVQSNIQKEVGTYFYKVTLGNVSKEIKVVILSDNHVEIIPSFKSIELPINEINTFDFTSLFSLYVDEKAQVVLDSMIDKALLDSPSAGNSYKVYLRYTIDTENFESYVDVNIIEALEKSIIVTSKDIAIYPNYGYLDLKKLFTITVDGNAVLVTDEMITGTIDYQNTGVYDITINYNDIEKISHVEVKRGVIIDYTKGEVVTIIKGTNQNTYSFTNDFIVMINGIVFSSIPDTFLLPSNVDFQNTGTYEVTIKIPYNENKIGLTGVKFVYYEKTITYEVVDKSYEINFGSDLVILPSDTTKYNVLDNIKVSINGKMQALTTTKEYVDPITCYCQILSSDIDFNNIGTQEVKVAVYVFGVNEDPVIVTYEVIKESSIKIQNTDLVIFSGETLYTKDLFVVMNNDEVLPYDEYMIIEGKVDTFTPGEYVINFSYHGIKSKATVIVLDNKIKGTYITSLKGIADEGSVEEGTYVPAPAVGNMIINSITDVTVDGKKGVITRAITPNELILKIGSNEYTLSYDKGIVVLNPDNQVKLGFSDYRRPLIYFHNDEWEILQKVVINSGASHVLGSTTICSSLDTFKLKSKATNEEIWYGLMIKLIDKTSADTIYDVTFGNVQYPSDCTFAVDSISKVQYLQNTYDFTIISEGVGRINAPTDSKKYANMTFNGIIDGKEAKLVSNQYQGLNLLVENVSIFSLSSMDIDQMVNGGFNYSNDTVTIYNYKEGIYSYKFILDVETKTFTLGDKDDYFGLYNNENNMLLFFDGFGKGIASFNTTSYYVTKFNYSVKGDLITTEYQDTKSSFSYGQKTIYSLDPLMNILTTRSSYNGLLDNTVYIKKNITDGAIVNISSYKVGQNADSVAKKDLYDKVEIITKDGILDNTSKAKIIDTSKIRFNTPGFYQMTITIKVRGVDVVNYYAIEILEAIYEESPVVASYGSGVIYPTYSLMINMYGEAILSTGNDIYYGSVKINEDNSFVIKAYNKDNFPITITGTYISEGIILIRCGGTVSFTDYYTTGTAKVTGTKGVILREIKVGTKYTYILSNAETIAGEVVSVSNNDGLYTIISNSGSILVKIITWDNITTGIELSDLYRGTYTSENNPDLVVDGFGSCTVGDKNGTYTLNSNCIMVMISTKMSVYRLNKESKTYELLDIALDNSLVNQKTFSSGYVFSCGYYRYTAETEFVFKDNGVVTCKSVSPSHDDGSDACGEDLYDPPFASKEGVDGKYSVFNNQVTIEIAGYSIIFIINDVVNPDKLTCTKTNIGSEEHGYFGVNTLFVIK